MPQLSVVIATKNRKQSLLEALTSLRTQSGVDFETIVVDDGSTDGSPEMVAADFPEVRLDRSPQSRGYIVQRNRGVAMAASPIVVLIDDDTALPHSTTLADTLKDFDHPRVGAVAMPFIDTHIDRQHVRKVAPSPDGVFVTASYIGCAHAVRRDLFTSMGGYWEPLQHYWEESDYCLRLLNAGYVTRLGRAAPSHHNQTAMARIGHRQRFYAARNTILTAWKSVPLPYALPHLAGVTLREFRLMARFGAPLTTLKGMAKGYLDGIATRASSKTRPVTRSTYRLLHLLKRNDGIELSKIEGRLAPLPG